MSYSSSNLSTTCLPHAVIWVDSPYHHQFFPYCYLSSRLHTSHFHIYHPHMFIDFEFDVSLYIIFLLPISPHVTLFALHHCYKHFHWMFLYPWLMRLLMHVAFHTRGHGVDHWVLEPSFPSFLLPYHLKPTLRSVS